MDTPVLSGELVVLRPIRADDADAMWDMVNDPEGRRLTGTSANFAREQVDTWCATVADREGRHDSNANLRLALRPGQRGLGFGSEAIQMVLAHAFDEAGLGLHRVSLDVLSINPRARMLYESLGFVVEGRLRESHRDGDFWCDAIVMAILEDDYRAGQNPPAR